MSVTQTQIIEQIYASVGTPDGWDVALGSLARMLKGSGGSLTACCIRDATCTVQASTGIMTGAFREAYARVAIDDPWLQRARSQGLLRSGVIEIGERLVPQRELQRLAFHDDFCRHYDYYGGITCVVTADASRFAAVSVTRRRRALFGANDVAFLARLLPHLRQALQLHQRLVAADVQAGELQDVLNRLPSPAIIVDDTGGVVHMNDMARVVLSEGDALRLDRGELRGWRPGDTRAVRQLIASATCRRSDAVLGAGGVVNVARRSGRRDVQVMVSPLRSSALPIAPGPNALILIAELERVEDPDAMHLQRLLGISRAEAVVARHLARRQTVKEIATLLALQENTVRFHLKSLFAKTGTRRQAELVALVLSLPAQL